MEIKISRVVNPKGNDTFTIEGLTLGKLIAIDNAFNAAEKNGTPQSPVAFDVSEAVRKAINKIENKDL